MLDEILKNMSLFVDGRGYAGNVEEVSLPKLALKTEEFRGGGMDAPMDIDMGMEKLEAEFTLTKFDRDVLKLFGLSPGRVTPLTMRGHIESEDGTAAAVIVNLRGKVREIDFGNWKPGDKATLKASLSLSYYKLTHSNEVLHEIDVAGMKRIIGGIDQLAATRASLGL